MSLVKIAICGLQAAVLDAVQKVQLTVLLALKLHISSIFTKLGKQPMRKQLPTTSIIHGIFTVSLLFIGSFLTINHVNAQSSENLYGLTPTANKVLGDKATDEKNISSTVGRSIQIALSFVGVLFMVLFVYAGFRWMTAQGNTDNVTVPKNMMIAATLGLFIVLAAYAVSVSIIDIASKATTN